MMIVSLFVVVWIVYFIRSTSIYSALHLIGQDAKNPPFQTYISSTEDDVSLIAALDLQTWQWQIHDTESSYRPFPRSFAIANIVNDTRMIYGLGIYLYIHTYIYICMYVCV